MSQRNSAHRERNRALHARDADVGDSWIESRSTGHTVNPSTTAPRPKHMNENPVPKMRHARFNRLLGDSCAAGFIQGRSVPSISTSSSRRQMSARSTSGSVSTANRRRTAGSSRS